MQCLIALNDNKKITNYLSCLKSDNKLGEKIVMEPEINTETEYEPQNCRRQRNDFWVEAKQVLIGISWVIFLIALVMSYFAAPDDDYGILRYYDVEIRKFWLAPLTGILYIMLWVSALTSYLALMVVRYRSRRQVDNNEYNMWFLIIVNLVWLIYILIEINASLL